MRGEIDEDDLGWRLGPRINSIGRIKNPRPALDLLLTDDRREAFRIASLLNQLNAERQRRTRFAVERAMAEVDPEQDFKVVVTEETGGIAGLIAGRVAGATGRPAAILTRRADDSYSGSARAGETDVDLYGALYAVRHLMGEWGGHRRAAGLSVNPGNFDAFVAGVNEAVRAQSEERPEIFVPAIEVDAEISLGSVSNGLLDWHEMLAPFGSGNDRPVFITENLRIAGSRKIWEGHEPPQPRRRDQGQDGRRARRVALGSLRRRVHGHPQPVLRAGRAGDSGLEGGRVNAVRRRRWGHQDRRRGRHPGGQDPGRGPLSHATLARDPGRDYRQGDLRGRRRFEVGGVCLAVPG